MDLADGLHECSFDRVVAIGCSIGIDHGFAGVEIGHDLGHFVGRYDIAGSFSAGNEEQKQCGDDDQGKMAHVGVQRGVKGGMVGG